MSHPAALTFALQAVGNNKQTGPKSAPTIEGEAPKPAAPQSAALGQTNSDTVDVSLNAEFPILDSIEPDGLTEENIDYLLEALNKEDAPELSLAQIQTISSLTGDALSSDGISEEFQNKLEVARSFAQSGIIRNINKNGLTLENAEALTSHINNGGLDINRDNLTRLKLITQKAQARIDKAASEGNDIREDQYTDLEKLSFQLLTTLEGLTPTAPELEGPPAPTTPTEPATPAPAEPSESAMSEPAATETPSAPATPSDGDGMQGSASEATPPPAPAEGTKPPVTITDPDPTVTAPPMEAPNPVEIPTLPETPTAPQPNTGWIQSMPKSTIAGTLAGLKAQLVQEASKDNVDLAKVTELAQQVDALEERAQAEGIELVPVPVAPPAGPTPADPAPATDPTPRSTEPAMTDPAAPNPPATTDPAPAAATGTDTLNTTIKESGLVQGIESPSITDLNPATIQFLLESQPDHLPENQRALKVELEKALDGDNSPLIINNDGKLQPRGS